MRTLGISITRDRLFAVLREQSLLSSRPERSCSVPCRGPFGEADDFSRLAEEIRKGTNGKPLPPAVLSIPPSWTYLRKVKLPVSDLPRAKKVHLAELEGNLPIGDEEILSDILPSAPGESGSFLAIAARRSAVEKAVSAVTQAGVPLDRVITDHVSLLLAALSGEHSSATLLSTLNDLAVLRLERGVLSWARQFPWDPQSVPADQLREIRGLLSEGEVEAAPPPPIVVFGEVPEFLAGHPGLVPYSAPADLADGFPIAYGAALAPFLSKETGGFSLKTSAETENERIRARIRARIAVAAAAVSLLVFTGSIETARYAGNRKVARIRAQIRKEFMEAVPGVKVVVRETVQVREKIRSLERQEKELGGDVPDPSTMLGKVSAALPKEGTVLVREAVFESGRLRLAGEAPSGQLVETFRASLASAFGTETTVTVQESEGSARGGTVKYTILLQKGGNGRAS